MHSGYNAEADGSFRKSNGAAQRVALVFGFGTGRGEQQIGNKLGNTSCV